MITLYKKHHNLSYDDLQEDSLFRDSYGNLCLKSSSVYYLLIADKEGNLVGKSKMVDFIFQNPEIENVELVDYNAVEYPTGFEECRLIFGVVKIGSLFLDNHLRLCQKTGEYEYYTITDFDGNLFCTKKEMNLDELIRHIIPTTKF